MKRSEITFSTLLVPIDFLTIFAAELAAYFVRFHPSLMDVRPVIFDLPLNTYATFALGIALIWLVIFACLGLYTMRANRTIGTELGRVILASTTGFVAVVLALFFQRELFQSRFILLAGWLLAMLAVCVVRIITRLCQHILLRRGFGVSALVLVGRGEQADTILQGLARQPRWGFRIRRQLSGPFTTWETLERELQKYTRRDCDGVLIAEADFPRELTAHVYEFCINHHLEFRHTADTLGTQGQRTRIYPIAGIPLVEYPRTPLDGWGKVTKRCFDIGVATLLLVFFLPIMVVAAVAILIDTGWPIFWSRFDNGEPVARIGQTGRSFRYFKLRSMRVGTHGQRYTTLAHADLRRGPLVKIAADPRVTRVGYWLRRFSIDELPELALVIYGTMSLVGPRPHLPEEVAQYDERHRRVFVVKPGITGLAQISGREHLSFEEEATLDEYYIGRWSLWLDLWILIKTPWVVLTRPAL